MENTTNPITFYKQFRDEQACIDYLAKERWGEEATCPRCGVVDVKFYKLKSCKFKCSTCRQAFSVRVGTIFEDSKLPLEYWFLTIYLATSIKRGISSIQLSKYLGITQKSAWYMLQRIRHVFEGEEPLLAGVVEMDETYIGGVRKDVATKFQNKTAVIGMVEKKKKTGQIKTIATKYADATTALPMIRSTLQPGSILQTDESRIYNRVKKEFEHHTLNHASGIYVDGSVTTNTIEGAWSHLKKALECTYISVSPKHLQKYCNEFDFKYNTRDMSDIERFNFWFRFISGKSLSYESLIR